MSGPEATRVPTSSWSRGMPANRDSSPLPTEDDDDGATSDSGACGDVSARVGADKVAGEARPDRGPIARATNDTRERVGHGRGSGTSCANENCGAGGARTFVAKRPRRRESEAKARASTAATCWLRRNGAAAAWPPPGRESHVICTRRSTRVDVPELRNGSARREAPFAAFAAACGRRHSCERRKASTRTSPRTRSRSDEVDGRCSARAENEGASVGDPDVMEAATDAEAECKAAAGVPGGGHARCSTENSTTIKGKKGGGGGVGDAAAVAAASHRSADEGSWSRTRDSGKAS